ncbi:hypothetical protein SNE40_005642 [Patella caerulea]|uniref:Uncharacterized protein n=1 Tax=Patella caerulea TaxID=87958 RepID=A0AAN8QBX4_PATCE
MSSASYQQTEVFSPVSIDFEVLSSQENQVKAKAFERRHIFRYSGNWKKTFEGQISAFYKSIVQTSSNVCFLTLE